MEIDMDSANIINLRKDSPIEKKEVKIKIQEVGIKFIDGSTFIPTAVTSFVFYSDAGSYMMTDLKDVKNFYLSIRNNISKCLICIVRKEIHHIGHVEDSNLSNVIKMLPISSVLEYFKMPSC